MTRVKEMKSVNPKLKQNQKEKKISCSSSTSQLYRNDKNMLSPDRIPPNSHKRRQKNSNTNLDAKSIH